MGYLKRSHGFILGWSLLLSLLLASGVWLSSHGSGLALRSHVNQIQHQQVMALAQLTLAQALSQWPQQQTTLWNQTQGNWMHYQSLFTPACFKGRCDVRYGEVDIEHGRILSGGRDDPAIYYQGPIGQRVLRRPRYVWSLLGQLPDGRLSYRVTVRAWGIDGRTVVTISAPFLWQPTLWVD